MNHRTLSPLSLVAIAFVVGLSTSAMAQRGGHERGGGSHGGWSGSSRSEGGSGSFHSDRGGSSESRSSHYGTVHNVFHENSTSRVTVEHVPPLHAHYDAHGWEWNHHDLFHDGYRWGYYHYDHWWRDDFFRFGFYVFTPVGAWVYSPWYYYPSLPPYILEDRVVVVNSEPGEWGWRGDGWSNYQWEFPSGPGGNYTDLDYALQDITVAWQDKSLDSISKIMPDNGRVAIYNDGHYSYSLSSSDFFNTMRDGTEGTRTTRYRILDVKTNGHDVANVLAEQVYSDPWDKPVTVYQTYRLVQEGPRAVIRSFGTYRTRPW